MFDFTKSGFDDQWKSIMMLLDRTNVLNDEFGANAKEATERVSASPADLQRWQQEGADHLQAQLTDNSQRDTRLADFDWKIAAADLSFQESSGLRIPCGSSQGCLRRKQARAPGDLP